MSRDPYQDLPQVATFELRSDDLANGETLRRDGALRMAPR